MKLLQYIATSLLLVLCGAIQAQKKLKGDQLEANQYVFEGNSILTGEKPDVLSAEKNYRRAIAKDKKSNIGQYNLGVSHYVTASHQEAADRFKQAAVLAENEGEKSAAFYNEGNAYFEMQKFEEAIESYKNALRNNPYDTDARKNLAIAKKMKEEQDKNKDKNKDQNKDDNKKEEDDKDSDDKKEEENEDKKEDGDDSDKDNEGDEEDEDKEPKEDEKDDEEKDPKDADKENEDDKQEEQPKPVEGQLSPDQVKSLLEAMADEEKKVQDKINAQKVKGARVKSDKDW